jgi:hypothetical protein
METNLEGEAYMFEGNLQQKESIFSKSSIHYSNQYAIEYKLACGILYQYV